ncbi:hypothetical protein [Desulfolutivibrio sulfoxidireducens]|uniref:hypothetical protein n=1 Tax=Desulfolutivibrio sulfoxidireducens TaxID=2773299 RepID=UPI00159E32F3|nr:hypothetical protein [Desulfolutivibrio sulfoxidireducens]QLA17004.1 hypothetical protein GD605_13345 [Desulfolutivibrio sulfoxidireducens]QLA20571.1 hypothetical protein GD604_13065 [Desulfolutivibrio sulfoxidireducens]
MIELGTVLCWLTLYVALCFGYYRWYYRPRVHLLMLDEEGYLDHYLSRLPHMKDRPGDRQGMVEFLMARRVAFARMNRVFAVAATALLVLVLLFSGS